MQRKVVRCLDRCACQLILNKVILIHSLASVFPVGCTLLLVLQDARIVAIVLVIVLNNDTRSLEHVPRVVNPTPQV